MVGFVRDPYRNSNSRKGVFWNFDFSVDVSHSTLIPCRYSIDVIHQGYVDVVHSTLFHGARRKGEKSFWQKSFWQQKKSFWQKKFQKFSEFTAVRVSVRVTNNPTIQRCVPGAPLATLALPAPGTAVSNVDFFAKTTFAKTT